MASFYNNYYKYYKPPYPFNNFSNIQNNSNIHSPPDKSNYCKETQNIEKNTSGYRSFGPINFKTPFFDNIEEPVFEIFGIQLYLDDIIILGLLFFLYQEGVQDEMLFISLILLLLS